MKPKLTATFVVAATLFLLPCAPLWAQGTEGEISVGQPVPEPRSLTFSPEEKERKAQKEFRRRLHSEAPAVRAAVENWVKELRAPKTRRPSRRATHPTHCPYEDGSEKDRAGQWSAISTAQATATSALERAEALRSLTKAQERQKQGQKGREEKMTTQIVVLLVILAVIVAAGILGWVALRGAARAAEAAAVTAQRQHQLALVNVTGIEEVVASGDYLHIRRTPDVPEGAQLPQALRQQDAGEGGDPTPVAFRHTRPGGVTEWIVGASRSNNPTPTAAAPAAAATPQIHVDLRGWNLGGVDTPPKSTKPAVTPQQPKSKNQADADETNVVDVEVDEP